LSSGYTRQPRGLAALRTLDVPPGRGRTIAPPAPIPRRWNRRQPPACDWWLPRSRPDADASIDIRVDRTWARACDEDPGAERARPRRCWSVHRASLGRDPDQRIRGAHPWRNWRKPAIPGRDRPPARRGGTAGRRSPAS